MVRRHRLEGEELKYVMKAVYLRLGHLLNREITDETEALFRVLWRFIYHRRGPPGYPEITRKEIESLLMERQDLLSDTI